MPNLFRSNNHGAFLHDLVQYWRKIVKQYNVQKYIGGLSGGGAGCLGDQKYTSIEVVGGV